MNKQTQSYLIIGSVISAAGALLFLFTSAHWFWGTLLGLTAAGLFTTQRLVSKSMALTAPETKLQLNSVEQKLIQTQKELAPCKYLENLENEGQQAADQAALLLDLYKRLKVLLNQKFEPNELTASRYEDAINNNCLSLSENLHQLKLTLESLNLTKPKNSNNSIESWDTQRAALQKPLKNNSDALGSLDNLYRSLNEINTKEHYRTKLEETMDEIKILADRAKNYSK